MSSRPIISTFGKSVCLSTSKWPSSVTTNLALAATAQSTNLSSSGSAVISLKRKYGVINKVYGLFVITPMAASVNSGLVNLCSFLYILQESQLIHTTYFARRAMKSTNRGICCDGKCTEAGCWYQLQVLPSLFGMKIHLTDFV